MRVAALVLVGCGRVAFDPAASAGSDAGALCTMPAGHDEDGDGIDDACDGCPHIFDPTQPDADGDGVNNACDPGPAFVHRIAFFDPFAGGALPGWTFNPPVAFVTDSAGRDSAQFDPTSAGSLSAERSAELGTSVFEIGARLGARMAGGMQLTVVADTEVGAEYYYCELFDNGSDAKHAFVYTFDGAAFTVVDSASLTAPISNGSVRLAMSHDTTITCSTSWPPTGNVEGPRPAIDATQIGLYTRDVVIDFDYFIQITRG